MGSSSQKTPSRTSTSSRLDPDAIIAGESSGRDNGDSDGTQPLISSQDPILVDMVHESIDSSVTDSSLDEAELVDRRTLVKLVRQVVQDELKEQYGITRSDALDVLAASTKASAVEYQREFGEAILKLTCLQHLVKREKTLQRKKDNQDLPPKKRMRS